MLWDDIGKERKRDTTTEFEHNVKMLNLDTFSDRSRALTTTPIAAAFLVAIAISIITTFIHANTNMINWSVWTNTRLGCGQTDEQKYVGFCFCY